jgi:peroxiredoxin
MRHLQRLHEKYQNKGLVILGFNCSDDRKIALEFYHENSATFPTILDASETATRSSYEDYKCSGVPLNYIIDKQGKVVDTWYGYEKGHKRALAALEKAGLKIEQETAGDNEKVEGNVPDK